MTLGSTRTTTRAVERRDMLSLKPYENNGLKVCLLYSTIVAMVVWSSDTPILCAIVVL